MRLPHSRNFTDDGFPIRWMLFPVFLRIQYGSVSTGAMIRTQILIFCN